MKSTLRRLLILLLGGGLLYGAYQGYRYFTDRASATDRLVNQVWIERMPRDDRDLVRFFHLAEDRGKRVGGTGRGSHWRLRFDAFVWSLSDTRLRLRFPQDSRDVQYQVRTWHCVDEAPKPFELCLTITTGDRTLRFYSRNRWKVRPREAILEDPRAQDELDWLSSGLRKADPHVADVTVIDNAGTAVPLGPSAPLLEAGSETPSPP